MYKPIFTILLLSVLTIGCETVTEEEVYTTTEIESQAQMPYEDDLSPAIEGRQ